MERTEPGPSKRAKVRMNEKNGRMAHRRIVAGRGIIRNHGRNNNSPLTRLPPLISFNCVVWMLAISDIQL